MSDGRRHGADDPALAAALRGFAAERPGGWSHDDWLRLLHDLRERGLDVSDPDAVGRRLEAERLALVLGRVRGMGPRRVAAVVERFGTVWELRHAPVDEIAAVPNVPRALAERVREEVGRQG